MTKQFEELTDTQWAAISPFLNLKRKRSINLRAVVNALLYMTRAGCQWRNLPVNFPNWRAVNYYFECWKRDGTLVAMNDRLNMDDRISEGRMATPSLLCVDSQSVKLSPMIFEERGIDNNKKVNGRKRQILVDTGGRLWRAVVHAANRHDGPGGKPLLDQVSAFDGRLEKILGDDAYNGVFAEATHQHGLVFEKASRPESKKGFVPIAKRWVVERTISWTNVFRRIVKDYEYSVESSATWLILANMTIMLQRIQRRTK
jgi:transposase